MTTKKLLKRNLILVFIALLLVTNVNAQSYQTWYKNAQERIDTLRKGNFGIQIFDKDGQPYTGNVAVRLKKHEFPFGIAFDFYEGEATMGNSYKSDQTVNAALDPEIYQIERWSNFLAYTLPVEEGKEYKLTLKFAETFLSSANLRLFDVHVNGELFLDDYDVFTHAGGQNIAVDTSITLVATNNVISLQLRSSVDNAAIKGIALEEIASGEIIRINCGGAALTTNDGNEYHSEDGFFDPDIKTVATNEDWMKAAAYKYFNYGASGNSFKWSGIQPQHTAPNYKDFDNAVKWTQKVGWELRAHTLLWGGDDDHSMPAWVRNLPTPQAITDTCKMRVMREVSHYKGIIKEYDVINEPLTDHADHLRKTVGDSIIWNCFKWAYEADSTAQFYINDYNVEYNWGQAAEYRDLILKVREMGGPVTAVGMQAHFWDCCRPTVDELVKNINIVAEAGLPIRLTEFDYGGNLSQLQQARELILVMTTAFSHPSVNGLISWALSDRGAWRENTGYFESNYQPKIAADTLLYYTKKKWATNFDSIIGNNPLQFNAYYGNYDIEVSFNDTVKVFSVPLLESNKDNVFELYEADAKLKGPQFVRADLSFDNEVKITFDKEIDPASLTRSNFKFFTDKKIGIEAVKLDTENPKAVLLTLSRKLASTVYASVSYFPGILKGKDGSNAVAFGPETVIKPDTENSNRIIDNGVVKIYPNPASSIITIESVSTPCEVAIFNGVGALVESEYMDTDKININVSDYERGIYMIKIIDSQNCIETEKILIK